MSDSKITTSLITKAYRDELTDYLTSLKEAKAIVWDQPLISTFQQFTTTDLMKECGMEAMYTLDEARPSACKTLNIVFVVRPLLIIMEKVARFVFRVKKEEKPFEMNKKKFHILFVPRKTLMCEKKLKELEVMPHVTSIDELSLGLFPLDTDVMSMHLDNAFRECFLDKNYGCLFSVGRSLMLLQSIFGTIPNIIGKGDMADRVINIMLRLKKEMEPNEPDIPPHIDNLIIVDRMVDPITPLLTQQTYEGLIDELFGIVKGSVRLPASKFESKQQQQPQLPTSPSTNPFEEPSSEEPTEEPSKGMKEIQLNSSEQLFAELRDLHYASVPKFLSQRTKSLRLEADKRHEAKSIVDIKEFVSKLPHIQTAKAALHTHLTVATMLSEKINDEDFMLWIKDQWEYLEGNEIDGVRPLIEGAILKCQPFLKVLRMICLQCICNDGFKPKLMDFYLRELIQSYGYHHIVTLNNLEKIGLLKSQGQAKTFASIARTYKLTVQGGNKKNDDKKPEDIDYTYVAYAPLSVRVVQFYNKMFWRGMEVTNDLLPGKVRVETQSVPVWFQRRDDIDEQGRPGSHEQKVTLVFFIGGVTHAEISAFRFLSHHDDSTTKYIIATTNMINGTSWLESISENLRKEPINPFL